MSGWIRDAIFFSIVVTISAGTGALAERTMWKTEADARQARFDALQRKSTARFRAEDFRPPAEAQPVEAQLEAKLAEAQREASAARTAGAELATEYANLEKANEKLKAASSEALNAANAGDDIIHTLESENRNLQDQVRKANERADKATQLTQQASGLGDKIAAEAYELGKMDGRAEARRNGCQ